MLLQGVSTSFLKEDKKNSQRQSKKRKSKRKTKKVANLTLDQQVTCFAEIIVNRLLNDMNFYEKD